MFKISNFLLRGAKFTLALLHSFIRICIKVGEFFYDFGISIKNKTTFVFVPLMYIISILILWTPMISKYLGPTISGSFDNAINLLICLIGFLFTTFVGIAVVELFYLVKNNSKKFKDLWSTWSEFHSFLLNIISLVALFSACDSSFANKWNLGIFCFFALVFLTTVIFNLYEKYFIKEDIVNEIYTICIASNNQN